MEMPINLMVGGKMQEAEEESKGEAKAEAKAEAVEETCPKPNVTTVTSLGT